MRTGRDHVRLRDSEIELLATVGAFRVVAERDLASVTEADIRSLSDQRLVESTSVVINHESERVLVLTPKARQILETHRTSNSLVERPSQQYYSGLVKPRELAHDAQLYRLFAADREQLEGSGARLTRVVLDYELKREYHVFVHSEGRAGCPAREARRAFADEHDLPFARGHITLPDVRIEYETADGRREHRDLELATEHYSRSQLSSKQSAGFHVYRAAGARAAGGSRRGGTPIDPHHLEWLR